jgi:small subunit ribosomal protein S6e
MPVFKLVISDPKTGKASSAEVKDPQSKALVGLRIGEEFDGTAIGLQGKLKVTGGSDKAGFPMRADISGGVKKRALLTRGVGLKSIEKGTKKRKLSRGNTVTEEIYQINVVSI